MDTFAADVEAGLPLAQLMRYRPLAQDPKEMALGMLYMSRYDIGVFKSVRLVPKPVQAWPIDGFSSGGAGWETLRGRESRARPVRTHDRREMRWSDNATSKKPAVLGRHFAKPQDWTGAGALALTVNGEGTGRRVRVRPTVDAPGGGVEHFDTWFTDETGHPRLGWPLHSAVERRSLPPLG